MIAARLSEDPSCRVVLLEAGERPPDLELMPVACAAMQLNPQTDWMYSADAGKAGLGLNEGRVPVPRGKMLGGSSGLNYMAYVRGHPADFDSWSDRDHESSTSFVDALGHGLRGAIPESEDENRRNERHATGLRPMSGSPRRLVGPRP